MSELPELGRSWDYAGTTGRIPSEMWIGLVVGQWPIRAFAIEQQAASWAGSGGARTRRIWKVRLSDVEEFILTEPIAPKLIRKETDNG